MNRTSTNWLPILIALVLALLIHQAFGTDVLVSFNPDPHDAAMGIVKTYSLWSQPTNAPDKNVHKWITQVQPNTNTATLQFIQLNATNLPVNCLLFVTADGISASSDYSAPYFYDYPALVQKMKPQPVTGLNAILK